MKKHLFKGLVVFLFLLLTLGLVACDDTPLTDTTGGTDSTTDETTDTSDSTTDETTDDPTPSDEKFVTISFVNGGDCDSPEKIKAGETYQLPTPHREGADFLGWFKDEALTQQITEIATNEDMTSVSVYAKWDVYYIVLNFRYGVDGVADTRKELSYGESLTLPVPDAREGYTFLGWKSGNTTYDAGNGYSYDDEGMPAVVSFTAQWSVNSYKVTYTVDGQTNSTEDLNYGTPINKTVSKTGYDFIGWSTSENGETINSPTVPASDMVLYAVFTPKTYQINFSVNGNYYGANLPENLASGKYAYDTLITLPDEITGYYINGWVVIEDGVELPGIRTSYRVGASYETVELRAELSPKKVTVTYGGDYSGSKKMNYGTKLASALPGGAYNGGYIVGWYYDADCTNPVTETSFVESETAFTLYAKTSAEKNAVVLHKYDGTEETYYLAFGEKLDENIVDTRTGYDFIGWNTENGKFTVMTSGSVDLQPEFRIHTVQINYSLGGGKGDAPASFSVDYNQSFTFPDDESFDRLYYNFVGWEYAGNTYQPGDTATVIDINATEITAVWETVKISVVFRDWDDTVIYSFPNADAGKTLAIAGNTVIENTVEFDRWVYNDEMGNVCVFENGVSVFTEDTVLRAVYVKTVYDPETKQYVKTDLVYPNANAFNFIDKNGYYYICGKTLDTEGNMTGAYKEKLPYDLVIPSTYNGRLVTGIYDKGAGETSGAFGTLRNDQKNASWFRTIYIPAAIRSIPNYAFYGHSGTVTFGLNSQCTHVGKKAFSYTSFGGGVDRYFYNFPSKLKTIYDYGFYFNVANSFSRWYWISDDGTQIKSLPSSITYIGREAFHNIGLFETVYINENVTYLGNECFYGMWTLKEMTIAETSKLTAIPASAFRATSLTYVRIPSACVTIGEAAFQSCYSLQQVDFSQAYALKTIGDRAFYDCPKITSLDLSNTVVESIGKGAFSNVTDVSTTIRPSSETTEIPTYTLLGITEVTFPETLKTIGQCAFALQSIESLKLPESLVSIEKGAFYGTQKLTRVDLSKLVNLETIGEASFAKYSDYKSSITFTLKLPDAPGLISIGRAAFANFKNIGNIEFSTLGKLETIDERAFINVSSLDVNLVLPEGLRAVKYYSFKETGIKSVTFPTSMTTVGAYSFEGLKTLKSISFVNNPDADDLTIEHASFKGCTSLEYVELPCQLVKVGGVWSVNCYNGAFMDCTSLETVVFRGAGDPEKERDLVLMASAFCGCTKLSNVYIERDKMATLSLSTGGNVTDRMPKDPNTYDWSDWVYANDNYNAAFFFCDPNLKIHVRASVADQYKRDTSWTAVFNVMNRAMLVADAE